MLQILGRDLGLPSLPTRRVAELVVVDLDSGTKCEAGGVTGAALFGALLAKALPSARMVSIPDLRQRRHAQ